MTDGGFAELEDRLGHRFRKPALLREALTHPSVGGPVNYQRLEFLGDRVLGVVMADALFARFPNLKEGSLARRFASLVKRETLAEVALGVGFDRALFLAKGAEDEGGRQKPAILADVCEAVIGALFLDGGIKASRQFIEREWRDLIVEEERGSRDPKSALQEWAQGRGLKPPEYVEVERSGPDHALEFTVEARLNGYPPAAGKGPSKRMAEKEAAEAMLAALDHA